MKKLGPFLIGGILGLLIAIIFINQAKSAGHFFRWLILGFIWITLSAFVHIILHEAGHLVFGLMSGYRFLSFRVGSFLWQKSPRGLKLFRFRLVGTGGQCLMDPPDLVDGHMPYVLYNMGGSLANLIFAILAFALWLNVTGDGLVFALIIFAAVGLVLALMNGIPLHLGMIANDGYNAVALGKDPEALRALWIQLKVQAELVAGRRLREMPADWFELPPASDLHNSMLGYIAILNYQRLMDERRFDEAKERLLWLRSGQYIHLDIYKHLMTLDLIYLALLAGSDPKELRLLLDEPLHQFMNAMKDYPPIIRSQIAIALLLNHDENEATRFAERLAAIEKTYPYPVEIDSEREYILFARERYEREKKT